MPSTFQKSCETEEGKYVGPTRRSRISQSQLEEGGAIPEVALFRTVFSNIVTSSCLVTSMQNGLFSLLSCSPQSQVLTSRTDIAQLSLMQIWSGKH